MSAEESMFSQENLETVGEAPAKASPAVLHVMVGLPRSGKSTYARSLDIPRVEVDAIRKALTGQAFCEDAEIMVTAITKVMVHALFMAGHTEVLLDEAWTCTAEYRDLWEAYGELGSLRGVGGLQGAVSSDTYLPGDLSEAGDCGAERGSGGNHSEHGGIVGFSGALCYGPREGTRGG